MKLERTLLLTFDYELFLGPRSGSVENCLIKPVKLLQSLFQHFHIEKSIFFVDTTYLNRLIQNQKSPELISDLSAITKQLTELLRENHYIFPHIHPHWLDAELHKDTSWSLLDLHRYAFSECSVEERTVLWQEAMTCLQELGVTKHHPVDGFRAGGWCIQPFLDFKPFFEQHGIRYDFSVIPGAYCHTNAQRYDFTEVKPRSIYRFSEAVDTPIKDGPFIEIPISAFPKRQEQSVFERMLLKWLWKTGCRSLGDGQGVLPVVRPRTPKQTPTALKTLSIEDMNLLNLRSYKQYIAENEVVHFISHPKMLSHHNLKIFARFLDFSTQNYTLNFDFKSLDI